MKIVLSTVVNRTSNKRQELLNIIDAVQECDATMNNQGTNAGSKKISLYRNKID